MFKFVRRFYIVLAAQYKFVIRPVRCVFFTAVDTPESWAGCWLKGNGHGRSCSNYMSIWACAGIANYWEHHMISYYYIGVHCLGSICMQWQELYELIAYYKFAKPHNSSGFPLFQPQLLLDSQLRPCSLSIALSHFLSSCQVVTFSALPPCLTSTLNLDNIPYKNTLFYLSFSYLH
jgi:hypothetical protein